MGILLGFVPFIVFALLTNLSVSLALWIAFAIAFVITIRDFAESPTLRRLDIAGVAVFGVLALYAGFVQPGLSVPAVRFISDSAFLIVAVSSLVRGAAPLTLPYAREHAAPELWETPFFLRTNLRISTAWTAAFALMAAADGLATFNRKFPASLAIALSLAALGGAIVFTARYPAFARGPARQPDAERALRG